MGGLLLPTPEASAAAPRTPADQKPAGRLPQAQRLPRGWPPPPLVAGVHRRRIACCGLRGCGVVGAPRGCRMEGASGQRLHRCSAYSPVAGAVQRRDVERIRQDEEDGGEAEAAKQEKALTTPLRPQAEDSGEDTIPDGAADGMPAQESARDDALWAATEATDLEEFGLIVQMNHRVDSDLARSRQESEFGAHPLEVICLLGCCALGGADIRNCTACPMLSVLVDGRRMPVSPCLCQGSTQVPPAYRVDLSATLLTA